MPGDKCKGNAIFAINSTVTGINPVFTRTISSDSGTIYNRAGSLKLINCTLYPADIASPVFLNSISNDFGVNGTQMRLYLQVEGVVKSILPWEHFLKFRNYDIIGIDSGIIKAATIKKGTIILPDSVVSAATFLDADTMGYDGGIFICCINAPQILSKGLLLSRRDTILDGFDAFNLRNGFTFKVPGTYTAPIVATFEI
jgi:hypothetical protein